MTSATAYPDWGGPEGQPDWPDGAWPAGWPPATDESSPVERDPGFMRAVTTLGNLTVGSRVNLEVDMIARYVERLASFREGKP